MWHWPNWMLRWSHFVSCNCINRISLQPWFCLALFLCSSMLARPTSLSYTLSIQTASILWWWCSFSVGFEGIATNLNVSNSPHSGWKFLLRGDLRPGSMWGSMWMTRSTRSLRAFRTTAMGRLLGSCWGQFAHTIHRNIVSCCTIFKANILTAHLFPCFFFFNVFLIHGFQLTDRTDIQPPTDQLSPMDLRLVTRHTKHAGVVQGFFISAIHLWTV